MQNEETIRAACAEAGSTQPDIIINRIWYCVENGIPLDSYLHAILALARRIEAEQAAVLGPEQRCPACYVKFQVVHDVDTHLAHPPTDRERVEAEQTAVPDCEGEISDDQMRALRILANARSVHHPVDREKLETTPTLLLCQQRERIAELEAALRKCGDQFQFYANEHEAAGKIEKAATNQRFADLCSQALKGTGNDT